MTSPFFVENLSSVINHYLEVKQMGQLGDLMLVVDLLPGHHPYQTLEIHGVVRDTKQQFEISVILPFLKSLGEATYYRVQNPPVRREEGGEFSSMGLTDKEVRAAQAFIADHDRPIWIEMLNASVINAFLIVQEDGVPAIYEVLGVPEQGKIFIYPYAVTILSSKPPAMSITDFVGGAQKIIDMHVKMLGRSLDEARYSLISEPETALMALSAFGYSTTRKIESSGRRVEVHLGQNPLVNSLRQARGLDTADG